MFEFQQTISDENENLKKSDAQLAAARGNIEIIRTIKQEGLSFEDFLAVAAYFHRNEIFDWLL